MDQEIGLAALERLGSPEAESRSQDYEGRRMIRIDGGYLILNFDRYRQKDHTSAARSQRYRERKSVRSTVKTPHRDDVASRVTSRSITHAEAEADTYSESERNPDGQKTVSRESEFRQRNLRAELPAILKRVPTA